MKNKVIILIIMILCCMNLLSEWTDFQDGISYFIENESESDIDDEIKDLLCYQNKIIMDDDYVYICKNGKISRYESESHDEDDPWQLDEVDGVSLFDTDNPRLIWINGNLF